jgi:hypothetical protein
MQERLNRDLFSPCFNEYWWLQNLKECVPANSPTRKPLIINFVAAPVQFESVLDSLHKFKNRFELTKNPKSLAPWSHRYCDKQRSIWLAFWCQAESEISELFTAKKPGQAAFLNHIET